MAATTTTREITTTASIPRHYGDRFHAHMQQASKGLILAARVAGEVCATYGHADYLAWARKMGVSQRTANRMLAVNRNVLDNPSLRAKLEDLGDALDKFSPSALYKLAEESTDDATREAVIDQAATSEGRVTARDVEEAKPKPKKREARAERVAVKRVDRRGEDDHEEVGNAFPTAARRANRTAEDERVEQREEIAELVEGTCEQLEEIAQALYAGFRVKGKEITHPYARQYTYHATIGSVREFIRQLRDYKPVGEDAKGVITYQQQQKRNALRNK